MNKQEAIAASKKGLKVSHANFEYDEFFKGNYAFIGGNKETICSFFKYRPSKSWDDGWVILTK